jgi:uncharacterized protein involved in exopolysaccharide biosynthesis
LQSETQYIQQEDTIDLRELLSILKRRKLLIIITTLLFTFMALAYVVIKKPEYQVQAVIELGSIDDKPLDKLQDIKQKLEHIYEVNVKKKERPLPRVETVSVDKKADSIFSIKVHGYSNDEAVTYIDSIVKDIEKEYAQKIDTYITTQIELITLTENDIKAAEKNQIEIQNTLKDYHEKILNLSAEDAALAGLYTIQISQNQQRLQSLQNQISSLKTKQYNLKLSIAPLKIKQTQIVGKIEVLDKPVKPKKALILVVAFITGLMLSVFLAFFLEFIKGSKKEEKTEV